jgi:hypothetical protein
VAREVRSGCAHSVAGDGMSRGINRILILCGGEKVRRGTLLVIGSRLLVSGKQGGRSIQQEPPTLKLRRAKEVRSQKSDVRYQLSAVRAESKAFGYQLIVIR